MTASQQPASSRVLVTGADGFVGRWLVRALRTRLPDARIFAASNSDQRAGGGAEALRLDVTNPNQVAATVLRAEPTCVVHLAAVSALAEARKETLRTWQVNLQGTLYLAEAVLRHAADARFIYAGTSEVYGATFNARGGKPLDETALLDPTNPYAASKAAADLLIGQMAKDGLEAVRFRAFNHTGPEQTEQFAIPAFAAQIARIEHGLQDPVLQVGNLEARRDFLDVRDVVDAYVKAILAGRGSLRGELLNLASGIPRRIGDILDELISRTTVRIGVASEPMRMRPNDTPVAVGNAERARAVLDWRPSTPWGRTVDDILDFWRLEVSRQLSIAG